MAAAERRRRTVAQRRVLRGGRCCSHSHEQVEQRRDATKTASARTSERRMGAQLQRRVRAVVPLPVPSCPGGPALPVLVRLDWWRWLAPVLLLSACIWPAGSLLWTPSERSFAARVTQHCATTVNSSQLAEERKRGARGGGLLGTLFRRVVQRRVRCGGCGTCIQRAREAESEQGIRAWRRVLRDMPRAHGHTTLHRTSCLSLSRGAQPQHDPLQLPGLANTSRQRRRT